MNRQSTEGFQGSEAILCVTVILSRWVHAPIHLSKLIECTTPSVNPNVKCGCHY